MSFVVFFYQGVNIQYTHGMIYMLWLFPAQKNKTKQQTCPTSSSFPLLIPSSFPLLIARFCPQISAKYQTALMLDLFDVQLYFMSKTQFTLKPQI